MRRIFGPGMAIGLGVALVSTMLLPLTGCGASDSGNGIEMADDLAVSAQGSAPGSGSLRLIRYAPVPWDGASGSPWSQELLHDPYFANFSERAAFTDTVGGHHWQAGNVEAATGRVERVQGAEYRGGYAMTLRSGDADVVLMQNTPSLPAKVPAGSWLVAQARARAEDPESLGWVVAFEAPYSDDEDGEDAEAQDFTIGEAHPGDGEWHTLVMAMRLEHDLADRPVTCRIVRKAGSEGDVQVDWTSLRITPRAAPILRDVGIHPGEVLSNPGLGMAFLGDPMGWNVAGYDSFADAPEFYWTSDLEYPDRGLVWVMPPAEDADTPLRVVQELPITPAMQGRELVLRLDARCNAPEALGLQVTSVINNRATAQRQMHPGDGQWRRFELRLPIPEDTLPSLLRFEILRTAEEADIAWVDRASVIIE